MTPKQKESLDKLVQLIQGWIEKDKVGSITVNFFKGGIANIIVQESVKI